MTDKKLGPVSQALLDEVNATFGWISFDQTVRAAWKRTGAWHSAGWWYRRLYALALEGHIEAKVIRDGDKVNIRFRRKKETQAGK